MSVFLVAVNEFLRLCLVYLAATFCVKFDRPLYKFRRVVVLAMKFVYVAKVLLVKVATPPLATRLLCMSVLSRSVVVPQKGWLR